MGLFESFSSNLKNISFEGRAGVNEYWLFQIMAFIISVFAIIFGLILFTLIPALGMLFFALMVMLSFYAGVASLGLLVRRLHDTNKSGWFLLLAFIPAAGQVAMLILTLLPGDKSSNDFGPSPLKKKKVVASEKASPKPVKAGPIPLWKIFSFMLLFIVALSWIIPNGTLEGSTFTTGSVAPLGLMDLIRMPLVALTNSLSTVVLVLAVGGFYGILNMTGVYTRLVNTFVNFFKDSRLIFAIFTATSLVILSALTSANLVLFIVVPFLATILLKLKYSKVTTMLATVAAILIGNFASLYSFKINGFINYYFQLDANNNLLFKLLLLVASIVILVFAIANDQEEVTTKNIPLYKENDSAKGKSSIPLAIIFDFTFILLLVATYNWYYGASEAFANGFFDTLHTNLTNIKIGDYSPVMNLLGNINPFGWWAEAEVVIILVLVSGLMGWIYSIKFNDIVYGFIDGAKEMMIPAFYAMLSFVIAAAISVNAPATIATTILNFVMTLSKEFSVLVAILVPVVGAVFNNSVSGVVEATAGSLTANITDTSKYPVFGIAYQTLHSLVMLVLPTSTLLAIGLSFFKVPFVDWIKKSWLLIVELLALALVVIILMSFIL